MSFSKAQREIIRTVQRLERKREPLNLTAIKRRHPDLLERVYLIEPFWGWKAALKASGIDYGTINVELLDYVNCRICGRDGMAILTGHLLKTHGITPEEYRAEYSEAEIMCETIRAARSQLKNGNHTISHWEPIFSPEYVLDRVAELYRCGFPMNVNWMHQHERGLFGYAFRHFESWDEVLRRVDLSPEKIRLAKPTRPLSSEDVIRDLQARQKGGLPLNAAALMCEDVSLYNAANRCFGTYAKALREAGIKHSEVRMRVRNYQDRDISRLIASVQRAADLLDDERAHAWNQLHQKYNRLACARFKNWTNVFKEAGVPRGKFLGRRFPDKEAVITALKARVHAGEEVIASAIFRADRTLFREVLRYFESFDHVFPALGIPTPASALWKRRSYKNRKAVLQEILRRKEADEPLTATSLRTGPFCNSSLLKAAIKFFGSWPEAIESAQNRHNYDELFTGASLTK